MANLTIANGSITKEKLDPNIDFNNSEVIDIRTASDGTQYDTAGNAVRGQVNNLKGNLTQIADILEIGFYTVKEEKIKAFINRDESHLSVGVYPIVKSGDRYRVTLVADAPIGQKIFQLFTYRKSGVYYKKLVDFGNVDMTSPQTFESIATEDIYCFGCGYMYEGNGEVLVNYTVEIYSNSRTLENINTNLSKLNSKSRGYTSEMYNKGNSIKTYDKKIAILCAGQSNADGRCPISELPSYITYPMTGANICKYESGNFSTINGRNYYSGTTGNTWAFDLITYYYLSQVDNQEIYVIKHTLGNTSISEFGANAKHWTPFYERLDSIDNSLLYSFEKIIRSAMKMKGEEIEIRALLWHQGEGDRASYSLEAAESYYDNFRYLISYIRGIVGNSRLPVIYGTISKKSEQYDEIIDTAIRRIADEDPYVYLVDMSDAELLDQYHFNSAWTEYFGKCVHDLLIDAGVVSAEKINPTKPISE